jgi:hypothetical protein
MDNSTCTSGPASRCGGCNTVVERRSRKLVISSIILDSIINMVMNSHEGIRIGYDVRYQ